MSSLVRKNSESSIEKSLVKISKGSETRYLSFFYLGLIWDTSYLAASL